MHMLPLKRPLWISFKLPTLIVVVTSLCASTSRAQVDDPRVEKWTNELRRAMRDEEYARTGPMAKVILTMRNACDPYLYWAWIEGFAGGFREELDQQILRARTGIETFAISDHFGPTSARWLAYANGESAAHDFVEGAVHEVEMQIHELNHPGFRKKVEQGKIEFLEQLSKALKGRRPDMD